MADQFVDFQTGRPVNVQGGQSDCQLGSAWKKIDCHSQVWLGLLPLGIRDVRLRAAGQRGLLNSFEERCLGLWLEGLHRLVSRKSRL